MTFRRTITTIIAFLWVLLFFILESNIQTPRWLHWLGPFTLAAIVSFTLVLPLSWLAGKIDLVDRPNARKIHEGAIPLVGGIAIYAGFLVMNLHYGYYVGSPEVSAIMIALGPLLLIGVFDDLLLLIGVFDDLWDLPATLKLLVQIGAAIIVISAGIRFTFLPPTWWGIAGENILTAVWLIGLTNAINFLDGIDGLATSLTMVAMAAFGFIALTTDQDFFMLLSAGLGGACLGFLPYNLRRRPAIAFLGDSGATILGFSLASFAIMGDWGGAGPLSLDIVVPILILGVPIFDTTFITITRFADGRIRTFREWLEYAGRDHIHHRLLKIGLSRFETVIFLCIISFILALSAITVKQGDDFLAVLSLLQGVIILSIIGRFMIFMEHKSVTLHEETDGSSE